MQVCDLGYDNMIALSAASIGDGVRHITHGKGAEVALTG
ncbi:hypothetical protein QFZ97_002211 [Paraburkholderia youngii]